MKKVSIKLDWIDALYIKSILSSVRRKDMEMMKIWERDREPVPDWMLGELDRLSLVIDMLETQINKN